MIKALLDHKLSHSNSLDIDHCDQDGRSALFYCCALGQIDMTAYLIFLGAALNGDNNHNTTIYDALRLSKNNQRALLQSVSISCERDAGALRNHLINPIDSSPVNHGALTRKLFIDIYPKIQLHLKKNPSPHHHQQQYDKNFYKIQGKYLLGVSLIDQCVIDKKFLSLMIFSIEKLLVTKELPKTDYKESRNLLTPTFDMSSPPQDMIGSCFEPHGFFKNLSTHTEPMAKRLSF